MNALRSIGLTSYELYARDYNSSLEKEVATVSDSDAQREAARSDEVILALGKKSQSEKAFSLAHYAKRAAIVSRLNQQTKADKKGQEESSNPIDFARANSLIGANAPLNWLVADGMALESGEAQPGLAKEAFSATSAQSAGEFPGQEVFSLNSAVKQASSEGSLMAQEWLLSPCA